MATVFLSLLVSVSTIITSITLNKLAFSLWQGSKKLTFELETWSKTEDVVQTLLQVCGFFNIFKSDFKLIKLFVS